MTTMTQGSAGIADEAFDSADDVPQAVKTALGRAGFRGVLLDGPRSVDLGRDEGVSLLAVHSASPADQARMSFEAKAILVGSRIEGRAVDAAWACENEHRPVPVDHAAATAAGESPTRTFMTYRIDASKALRSIVKPGTLCTWVIGYDVASNPVTTRCEERPIGDPAVAAFVRANRPGVRAAPGGVMPGPAALPNFHRHAASPAVPAKPGVAMAVERVVVGARGAACVLRGSFRLPVADVERVPARGPDDVGPWVEPRPTAQVALAIVLTGDTSSAPELIRVRAPSYDPIDPADPRPHVTGWFNLDLAREVPLEHQTYAVWAVHGDLLAGPVLVSWVDPALLAPRS